MTQNALSPRETPNFFQLSLLRSAPGAIFRQESFWGAEEKTRGAKVFRGGDAGRCQEQVFRLGGWGGGEVWAGGRRGRAVRAPRLLCASRLLRLLHRASAAQHRGEPRKGAEGGRRGRLRLARLRGGAAGGPGSFHVAGGALYERAGSPAGEGRGGTGERRLQQLGEEPAAIGSPFPGHGVWPPAGPQRPAVSTGLPPLPSRPPPLPLTCKFSRFLCCSSFA